MDCLDQIGPGKQLAVEVDHSAGHAKYLWDGLHVANMNVKYGGKQKVPVSYTHLTLPTICSV